MSVADAVGYVTVADDAGDVNFATAAGDGSAVGCSGVSDELGTGVDGSLHLYSLLFLLLDVSMFTMVILSE